MKETRIMMNEVRRANDLDESLEAARRRTGYYEYHSKQKRDQRQLAELENWIKEVKSKKF